MYVCLLYVLTLCACIDHFVKFTGRSCSNNVTPHVRLVYVRIKWLVRICMEYTSADWLAIAFIWPCSENSLRSKVTCLKVKGRKSPTHVRNSSFQQSHIQDSVRTSEGRLHCSPHHTSWRGNSKYCKFAGVTETSKFRYNINVNFTH